MAYHRPGGNANKRLLDKQEGWKMNLWMRSTHIQKLFTSRYKLLKVVLLEGTSSFHSSIQWKIQVAMLFCIVYLF